jgi:hypothetical protein
VREHVAGRRGGDVVRHARAAREAGVPRATAGYGETLVVAVDPDERPLLVEAHPEELFVTRHYENWPLVLVALARARSQLVRELIEDAWAAKAPKRVVEAWLAERDRARA